MTINDLRTFLVATDMHPRQKGALLAALGVVESARVAYLEGRTSKMSRALNAFDKTLAGETTS